MKSSNSGSTKARAPKVRNGDNPNKKIKKKISVITQERVSYVDYKDVNLLQRFVSDRSKIRARRVSGNDVQQQRDVTTAIKNARELALMPYAKRVTTTRGGRPDRGDRGDRGDRRGPAAAAEEVVADVVVEDVADESVEAD
jgi:small subunit ribosomal protein S18